MNIYEHRIMDGKNELEQATQAIGHVLRRIATNPAIFNMMGPGSEAFDLLTESFATLTGEPVVDLRMTFYNNPNQPR